MAAPGSCSTQRGPKVPVQIFTSADLPAHWSRLDTFEGSEYRRVTATAATPGGPVPVSIYELAGKA